MEEYLSLLERLIATPSFSREEEGTASILEDFLSSRQIADVHRDANNVWAACAHFDASKPTLLLNSHHDTVRPSASYTRDPFLPTREDGRIYGLGSNDAGASVVSLTAAFCSLYHEALPFNLILALSAEEEITGENGIRRLLPTLPVIDMGIVGEPTGMDIAVGERGLVVLDGLAKGVSGHAAHDEGCAADGLGFDNADVLVNLQNAVVGRLPSGSTRIDVDEIVDVCQPVVAAGIDGQGYQLAIVGSGKAGQHGEGTLLDGPLAIAGTAKEGAVGHVSY